MFDILGRGAVKVAEAAGIVDEQPEPVEVELAPQPVPEHEAKVITVKQIGLLKPVVKNPQTDLEVLAELFGVYKGEKSVWQMQCPECCHEDTMDAVPGLALETEVECSDCNHVDSIANFYEGTATTAEFSRTPTPEEAYLAVGNFHAVRHGWNIDSFNDYKKYYLYLLGKDDGLFIAGENAYGFYQHCSDRCKRDDCRCSSPAKNLFGSFQPLEQRRAEYYQWLADKEDD